MSGALGLVAAALGMPRDDDARLRRLAACWMAVREDRGGRSLVDFHTVGGGAERYRVHGAGGAVLTHREYLSDASFLVALGFDDHLLAEEIDRALGDPHWILYLGRAACAPSMPIRVGLYDGDPETALRSAPWPWPERPVARVRLIVECPYGRGEPRQDHPLSFRPGARAYKRRWVETRWIHPREVFIPGQQAVDAPSESDGGHSTWARPAGRRSVLRDARMPEAVYHSRAFLNVQNTAVTRDLEDVHAMHRRVMLLYPNDGLGGLAVRARHGVLYRVERDTRAGVILLHVQSTTVPEWDAQPEGYLLDTSRFFGVANPSVTPTPSWPAVTAGEALTFELRANVTERSGAKRVGLHGRAGCMRGPLHAWLESTAERAGFALCGDVNVVEEAPAIGQRPSATGKKTPLTFASALFSGRLIVIDPAQFRAALVGGVGPGKAFGFGLLSVASPR